MSKSHGFDMTLPWEDGEIRVTGTITAGYPATGPTYDCGGTPAEPPEIEDFQAFAFDGTEIEDTDEILAALEDTIMEQASEDADCDADDAAEARADSMRMGD